MATRTVRLDDEAEATLKKIRDATGLPISEALKRGLRALQEQVVQTKRRTPWEGYCELDIGPGGNSLGPATESRRLVSRSDPEKARPMILVDTGPLVSIFDRTEATHSLCLSTLRALQEPLVTTTPVLTEAFFILGPGGRESDNLRQYVVNGDLSVSHFDASTLLRAFELMETYSDRPMDLADASLVTAAESLNIRTVFTLDRRDFEAYRVRRGHRYYPIEILPRVRH